MSAWTLKIIEPEKGNKTGIPIELDDGTLVLVTHEQFDIFVSTDNGATWALKYSDYTGTSWDRKRYGGHIIADDGSILVGMHYPNVYNEHGTMVRSTDSGQTWSVVLTSEGNSFWNFCKTSNGDVYVNEYSSGGIGITEEYGYNVWKSTDNGATWSKFYEAPHQSTPGAQDGIRHVHLIACDSDDRLYVTFGEPGWGELGGRSYRLGSDGVLGAEIGDGTNGNGWTASVTADDGKILFGTDGKPNKIWRLNDPSTDIKSQMVLSDVFTNIDTEFFGMGKGFDGVLYAITNGNATVERVLLASPDDGISWVALRYTPDDFTISAVKMSVNPTGTSRKLYISVYGIDNYFIIKDYSRAEIRAMLSPSILTIKSS